MCIRDRRDPGRHLIVRGRDTRAGKGAVGDIEFVIVRPSDAPAFVGCGGADCGICGWDSLIEADLNLLQLVDLDVYKRQALGSIITCRSRRRYSRTRVRSRKAAALRIRRLSSLMTTVACWWSVPTTRCRSFAWFRLACARPTCPCAFATRRRWFASASAMPVSYTHLDVYKRQPADWPCRRCKP